MRRSQKLITLLSILNFIVFLMAIFSPMILRSIPSRYVLYLPEPIQELGQRDTIETLPTPDQLSNLTIEQLITETRPSIVPFSTIPPVVVSTSVQHAQSANLSATPSKSPPLPAQPTPSPIPTEAYPTEMLLGGIKRLIQSKKESSR